MQKVADGWRALFPVSPAIVFGDTIPRGAHVRVAVIYRFGPFRLDSEQKLLFHENEVLDLTPKAVETLLVLVERRGRIVTREELCNAVWPGIFVEYSNLAHQIAAIRKALGETPGQSRYIQTVARRGYTFVAEASVVAEQPPRICNGGSDLLSPTAGIDRATDQAHSSLAPSEFKPQSRKGRAITVALACLLALSTILYVGAGWKNRQQRDAGRHPRISLAVLPLVNLAGDALQPSMRQAMAQETLTQLGTLNPESVAIIDATAIDTYTPQKNVSQIGRELGVDFVLKSSVLARRQGLRVDAQLIRVRDSAQVWARSYDVDVRSDVGAVEQTVASSVANAVRSKLQAQSGGAESGTAVAAAFQDYRLGRFFWNQRTEDGYRKALPYFQDAIRKDPTYAQAYAGLADTYSLLGSLSNSLLSRREAMLNARGAALRAVEIDPNLAEGHTSLAFVEMQYDRDWELAEKEYRRAIELDPGYMTAHHWYAYLLIAQQRIAEALEQITIARDEDPLSLVVNADFGEMYYYAHQFDRAIQQYRNVLEMDSHFLPAYWQIAAAYVHERKFADALAALRKAELLAGDRPETEGLIGYVYAVSGQRRSAEQMLQRLQLLSKHRPDLIQPIALIEAGLGNSASMFASLQRACEERTGSVILVKVDPNLDDFHSDPRYTDMVRCVGLTP